jgi:hypothetical protein
MARPDATDDAIHTNTARRDKLIVLGRDIDLLSVAGKDSRRAGRSPRYWAIYEFSRLANRDGELVERSGGVEVWRLGDDSG